MLLSFTLTYYLISSNVLVTFNANGGTFETTEDAKTIKTKANKLITAPDTPINKGYTLVGWTIEKDSEEMWDFENDKIKDNTILYAKWETESLDTEEPENPDTIPPIIDEPDDNNPDIDEPDTEEPENPDVIEPIMFDVEFVLNGGSLDSETSLSIKEGSLLTKPNEPIYFGYMFMGWFTDINFETEWNFETDVVNDNLTLYAKWQVNTYLVTFDLNGGTLDILNKEVVFNSVYGELPTPVLFGYTFTGWTLNGEFITKDSIVSVANDHTLVANWEIDTFTIKFNLNGGSLNSNEIIEAEFNSIIDRPVDPTYFGHTFVGWYADENLENEFDFETKITNNLTIYAKWDADYEFVERNGEVMIVGAKYEIADRTLPNELFEMPVVAIGDSVFRYDKVITNLVLNDNLINTGIASFADCPNLESVTLGKNLTQLGNGVFATNPKLTSVTFNDNLRIIGEGSFNGTGLKEIIIPNTIEAIGSAAFGNCLNLETVVIGDGVTVLAAGLFVGDISLKNVTIGKNVKTIETSVFNSTGIEELVIPDNVTEISDSAFQVCHYLENITIGSGIKNIPDKLFFVNCQNLKNVTLSEGLEVIGQRAFANTSITEITIPNSVITISAGAFMNCMSLTTITFGDNVTSIGFSTFEGCENLENVKLNDKLETIEYRAFYNCYSLKQLVLKASISYIGNAVFQYVTANIFYELDTIPTSWHQDWNFNFKGQIYYSNEWEYVDGVPTLKQN